MRRKRIMRKVHNAILRGITIVASALVVLAAGCADTPGTNAPFVVAVVSLAWLTLFAYANCGRRMKHAKPM